MTPDRRLIRIEAKVNIVARALGYLLVAVFGLAAYFVFPGFAWSVPLAIFAGGITAWVLIDSRIGVLERRHSDDN